MSDVRFQSPGMTPPTPALPPSTRGGGKKGSARGRNGFTLVEMLVVIAIIVGVLAMAVPLVSALNGNRSVEAGYNEVSSAVAHARSLALYGHGIAGAFFYIDPITGRSA